MLCAMETRIASAPSKHRPELRSLPSLERSANGEGVSGELRVSGSDLPGTPLLLKSEIGEIGL